MTILDYAYLFGETYVITEIHFRMTRYFLSMWIRLVSSSDYYGNRCG
jgi:hypothetical protein